MVCISKKILKTTLGLVEKAKESFFQLEFARGKTNLLEGRSIMLWKNIKHLCKHIWANYEMVKEMVRMV